MKKFITLMFAAVLMLAASVFAQDSQRQQLNGTSVICPVELKTSGPSTSTTDDGVSFTVTTYAGSLANGDVYGVAVSNYPFTVDAAVSYPRMIQDAAKVLGGTITSKGDTTVASGQVASVAIIDFTGEDVKAYRAVLLVTSKGSNGFGYMFLTAIEAPGTDLEAMKAFFTTIQLN
jgi:hypothetical protein